MVPRFITPHAIIFTIKMMVCLGVPKLEERASECEDSEEASYYTFYSHGASKL
jgi:hypothetical protein